MEYYSKIEKNKLSIHIVTWMDLKGVMLSDKSQTSRDYVAHDPVDTAFLK